MRNFVLIVAAALALSACDNSETFVHENETNVVVDENAVECDESKLKPNEHCK